VGDDLGYCEQANAFFEPAACTSLPATATSGDNRHVNTATRPKLNHPNQCAHPPRPAVDALHVAIRVALRTGHKVVKVAKGMKERSAAQHQPALLGHWPPSSHSANCRCSRINAVIRIQNQQAISASSLSRSYRPLRSPLNILDIRWWGDPCQLGLHKAERSPGHARCPLSSTPRRPQRMTSTTAQHQKQTFPALRSSAPRR
jgi:hypothetical protein